MDIKDPSIVFFSSPIINSTVSQQQISRTPSTPSISNHSSNNPSPTTPTAPSPLFEVTPYNKNDDNDDDDNANTGVVSDPFKGFEHRRAFSEVNLGFASEPPTLVASCSDAAMEEINGLADDDFFSRYIDMENFGEFDGNNNNDIGGDEGEKSEGAIYFCGDHIEGGKNNIKECDNGAVAGDDHGKEEEQEKERLEGPPPSPHRHNNSGGGVEILEAKKAMSASKLAELWVQDPKRAKRILANRQSAARSKERKARYISELERKVKTLQTEATTLATQLNVYKRDAIDLAAENTDLKLLLQTMEHQAQLRDDMTQAMKVELERLRFATGELRSPSTSLKLGVVQLPPHMRHHNQAQLSFFQGIFPRPPVNHQPSSEHSSGIKGA